MLAEIKRMLRSISKYHKPEFNSPLPEFAHEAEKSIQMLGNDCPQLENDEAYEFLIKEGIEPNSATNIILLLPTVFCRRLFPTIEWPNYYNDLNDNGICKSIKYSADNHYTVLNEVARHYFENNPDDKIIKNIAWRSAEFKIINHALLNGNKIVDLTFSPVCLSR